MMKNTQVRSKTTTVLLDSAGQCLGAFVLYPGRNAIKQRIVKAIRTDFDNFEAIVDFLDKDLVYKSGERVFQVSIKDDKDDDDPTIYVYYLKEIQLF